MCWKECNAKYKYNKKMATLGVKFDKYKDGLRLGTKYDYKPDINCVGEKNKHDWVEAHISKLGGDGKNVIINIKYRYCNDIFEEAKDLIFPNPKLAPCGGVIKERSNCSQRANLK